MLSCLPTIRPSAPQNKHDAKILNAQTALKYREPHPSWTACVRHVIVPIVLSNLRESLPDWCAVYQRHERTTDLAQYTGFLMGYEFEFTSSVDQRTFATAFVEVMRQLEPSAHKPDITSVQHNNGYHGSTRDLHTWHVESDSSIRCNHAYPTAIEFVTAPLPINQILFVLPVISSIIRVLGDVNVSCGLHFTVGHDKINQNFDTLSFLHEFDSDSVLKAFSRTSNEYCRPTAVNRDDFSRLDITTYLREGRVTNQLVSTAKYRSVNFGKLSRGLIELRAMGGEGYVTQKAAVVSSSLSFLEAIRKAVDGGYRQRRLSYRKARRSFGITDHTSTVEYDADGNFPVRFRAVAVTRDYLLARFSADSGILPVTFNDSLSTEGPSLTIVTTRSYFAAVFKLATAYFWLRAYHYNGVVHFVITRIVGASAATTLRAIYTMRRTLPVLFDCSITVMVNAGIESTVALSLQDNCSSTYQTIGLRYELMGDRFFFGSTHNLTQTILTDHPRLTAHEEAHPLAIRATSAPLGQLRRDWQPQYFKRSYAELRGHNNLDARVMREIRKEILTVPSIEEALVELAYLFESFPDLCSSTWTSLVGNIPADRNIYIGYRPMLALLTVAVYSSYGHTSFRTGLRSHITVDNAASILGGLPELWQALTSLEKEFDVPLTYVSAYFTVITVILGITGVGESPYCVALAGKALAFAADHPLKYGAGSKAHREQFKSLLVGKLAFDRSHVSEKQHKELFKMLLRGPVVHRAAYFDCLYDLADNAGQRKDEAYDLLLSLYKESVHLYLDTGNTKHLDIIHKLYAVSFNRDGEVTPRKVFMAGVPGLRVGLRGFKQVVRVASLSALLCSEQNKLLGSRAGRTLMSLGSSLASANRAMRHIMGDRVAYEALVAYVKGSVCRYKGKRVPSHRILDILTPE